MVVGAIDVVGANEELVLTRRRWNIGIDVTGQQAGIVGRQLEADLLRRSVTHQQLRAVVTANVGAIEVDVAEIVVCLEVPAGPDPHLG